MPYLDRHTTHFWYVAGLFGLVSAVFLIWVALRLGGPSTTDEVDVIGELVAALVAGAACGVAALKSKNSNAGWALLAASSFTWAAGEAVWCYYDLGLRVQVPFPSLADVGFLAAVPPAVVGLLLLYPSEPRAVTSHLRGLLDSLLISGSVLFVSWLTVLGAVYRLHQGGVMKQTVSLAYPVSDVVLASLVVILATRPGARNRMCLGLVLAGMLGFALSDSSFAYLTALNSYGIGNALDTGWVAGYLLVALGAVRALSDPFESTTEESRATLWMVLGPYLPLAAAGGVFLWRVTTSQAPGTVPLIAGFGLVLLMSVRQIVVLLDNRALTRQLDTRVEERTLQLHHQAFHDGLTGLANRALFNEYLANAVRRRSRSGAALAVLFVDLDRFTHVNDLHGHDAGDEVLQAVARRFQQTLRSADTVARLGGDEFAILVEDEPLASDPGYVARRLLRALDRPFRVGSEMLSVYASVGIATDQSGCETADEILRNADLAMYSAKSKAKHSYEVYAPEMHTVVLDRMRTEAELRHAVENGEFVLHYQPVINLSSGAIVGVEALIRWNHPERGLVSPGQFIPIAESTGLIVPIGAWVLQQACRQAQAWRADDLIADLSLSVNLTAPQLADEHLMDIVSDALELSGFDSGRLTLEVTESVIMDDLARAIEVLHRLRRLGVKIAIDDFGTGHSSLSALRDLPVDTLKIDRSFVIGIARSKKSADLVRRTLQLAADFGLHTVAEGVEEREQLEVLQGLGCDSVQGFYFHQPLTATDVKATLQLGAKVRGHQWDPVAGLSGKLT
jgi:diguanylate cyclase (GGDEF)-like protein